MAHAVHQDRDWPERDRAQDQPLNLIASFKVMRASSAVYEAVMAYHKAKTGGATPAEIEAAKQALEAALV